MLTNKPRQRQACESCSKKKRKCTGIGKNPCDLCVERGESCVYRSRVRRGPKPKRNFNVMIEYNSEEEKAMKISRIIRLSPSVATGLMGSEENLYLNTFKICFEDFNFFQSSEIQLATSQLLLEKCNKSSMIWQENNRDGAIIKMANRCTLWASIATGALLEGNEAQNKVRSYLKFARESLKNCFDEPTPEVMRAYILLANAYLFIKDVNGFSAYFGWALTISKNIEKKVLDLPMTSISYSNCDFRGNLHEDLWIWLECMKKMRHQSGTFLSENKANEKDLSCTEEKDESENGVPYALSCFAPKIEGLTDFKPEFIETKIEEGGYISESYAKVLARRNVVSLALTDLANLNDCHSKELVRLATRDFRALLPVCVGIYFMSEMIMKKVLDNVNISEVEAAASKLLLLAERMLKSFRPNFFKKPGLIQIKLLMSVSFLRLLMGNEEGCKNSLLMIFEIVSMKTGIISFPALHHDLVWLKGLLCCGNLQKEFLYLEDKLNGIYINGSTLSFSSTNWESFSFHGKAVGKVLNKNFADGKAKIFTNFKFPIKIYENESVVRKDDIGGNEDALNVNSFETESSSPEVIEELSFLDDPFLWESLGLDYSNGLLLNFA